MLCDDHGSGLGFVNAHDEHEHTSDGLNIPPSHYQLNFRKISRRSLTMAVPGCRGCARSTPRLRNHVDGAARASSPIVAGARGDGQWGKAAGCSGTCLKAGASGCRCKSGNGKGAGCVTKRGCPSEMTA